MAAKIIATTKNQVYGSRCSTERCLTWIRYLGRQKSPNVKMFSINYRKDATCICLMSFCTVPSVSSFIKKEGKLEKIAKLVGFFENLGLSDLL